MEEDGKVETAREKREGRRVMEKKTGGGEKKRKKVEEKVEEGEKERWKEFKSQREREIDSLCLSSFR